MASGTRLDISVKVGQTLDVKIPLFADPPNNTVPLDLTGAELVEVTFQPYDLGENPGVSLILGQGVTVPTPTNGEIHVVTPITASSFSPGLGYWYAKVIDSAKRVLFPKAGRLTVGRP